LPAAPLLRH